MNPPVLKITQDSPLRDPGPASGTAELQGHGSYPWSVGIFTAGWPLLPPPPIL